MTLRYEHSPRPVGGPISFTLKGERLTVDSGRKVHEVSLGAVETVRMTYEPGRFGQKVYRTRIRMQDGRTFAFSSLTWRSLVEARSQPEEYRRFARGLFSAIAGANPQARFVAGKSRPVWVATAALTLASLLAMAYLVWRALQMNATGIALLGGLFALVGIWQLEPLVRLNRPRPFSPDAPPEELMPQGS
ncbi:hypothetical protein [Microvirga thermotolerans]|uniref:Uncharacterized protein n=1 Tax=Microvirga thermotolerans TaxID=2651334 RepID=A0A5P9JY43_9HYPH|nr:hypothetical protein [Microvirga thermotolerans]QFU16155.1 hypothetical protein GDR74_07925 [Microvirga thermotolerans]